MGRGQPALLYIVPLTLGTTVVIGWLRKELRQLWNGEPVSNGCWSVFSSRLFLIWNISFTSSAQIAAIPV